MVKHIAELNIKAYRGIRNLNLNDLGSINIIVGANNCGKTSVLEAIKVMENPEDIGSILNVASGRRAMKTENFSKVANSIFQDTEEGYCLDIQATINSVSTELKIFAENSSILAINNDDNDEIEEKEGIEGKIQVYENGKRINGEENFSIYNLSEIPINEENKLFNSIYIHSNVGYYISCLKFIKDSIINNTFKKNLLMSMVKIFDKNINDISILGSEIYLHDDKDSIRPFFSYGTGTQKAVLLAAVISQCEDGIVLIDEIDNAIHKTALNEIFLNFLNACRQMNIQAFITTHSLEALDVMLQVNESLEEDTMRVITLKKNENKTVARVLTGLKALEVRDEYNLELR